MQSRFRRVPLFAPGQPDNAIDGLEGAPLYSPRSQLDMRIVIAGGTGFIGRPLCQRLLEHQHRLVVLTRNPQEAATRMDPRVELVPWQGSQGLTEGVSAALRDCQVIINLAGAPVADRRWSGTVKNRLRTSREATTTALVMALAKLQARPGLLLNASAIGYYGPRGDELVTEDTPSGTGFLASLCRDWEGAARAAERLGVRVALIRIGVVLGRGGGALEKMLPAFRLGFGGPLGSGSQWMSWIHVADLVELLAFSMNQAVHGPVNATAPHPVSNREFASTLARTLGKPAWLKTPGLPLRLLLGQMAEELLLTGQRVVPERAREMGFHFRYPQLSEALHALLA